MERHQTGLALPYFEAIKSTNADGNLKTDPLQYDHSAQSLKGPNCLTAVGFKSLYIFPKHVLE